jgi:hypothetical protein
MDFRLLISIEVIEFLQKLPAARRKRLVQHFRRIQDFPGHYSDYIETDSSGRRVDVSVFDGFAIVYWADVADRHLKILELQKAD